MPELRKKYPFDKIEPKWQRYWSEHKTFAAHEPSSQHSTTPSLQHPKLYVLDMFPYPSGAGLHVGHPEGYTATDIYCRFKRMNGFNVLHPMGWDAFGLPAEQYAIDTGTHPAVTTRKNIDTFRRQIQMLGFSYDWDREVDTTDPKYFKWTQWIFLQLFKKGLAYEAEVPVWWCEGCKAVLANEEVNADGTCDRKGHKNVYRRPLRQWILKITEYAPRLLEDLKLVDWPESIKEQQRNWIGRSEGAEVTFIEIPPEIVGNQEELKKWSRGAKALSESFPLHRIRVFTTRPDTLYGATYMVLAPEHHLVDAVTTPDHRDAVKAYCSEASRKSELERTALEKEKTGVFTGGYALNPVNDKPIPIWVADYVLSGYGTGAIMAVPAHDTRDFEFAKKFGLEIIHVVAAPRMSGMNEIRHSGPQQLTSPVFNSSQTDIVGYWTEGEPFAGDGISFNSPVIDRLPTPQAKQTMIEWLEHHKIGKAAVQYKLRDWLFSRQRYWGEPIPIVHCKKHGTVPVPERELPLTLPEMKDYTPTANAEPPLAKATDWVNTKCPQCGEPAKRETNTMPQWAGSCWYYLRYIDPHNIDTWKLCQPSKEKYWMPVDLYVGGAEHAVLHLLYSRFWHKVLFDLGHVSTPEPFMRLVNQGMILGEMEFFAFTRASGSIKGFVTAEDIDNITEWVSAEDITAGPSWLTGSVKDTGEQVVALKLKDGARLVEKRGEHFYLKSRPSVRVEAAAFKMSKSRGNVINPDDVVREYGADSFRMYEMFMGPLEAAKPWSTQGLEGVYRFLGRVWRLFCDEDGKVILEDSEPDPKLLKVLHHTIKKVGDDTDTLAFNTAVSTMMEFVNAVTAQASRPRVLLEPFVLVLAPYAPHLAEELWEKIGHKQSLTYEPWPKYDAALLKEDTVTIILQVNGKLRDRVDVPADTPQAGLEKLALTNNRVQEFLAGKQVRKVIVVPGKLVNVVAG